MIIETNRLTIQTASESEMRSIIEKQTDPENKKSQRVLEKCGFAPLGIIGEEGPRFYRKN